MDKETRCPVPTVFAAHADTDILRLSIAVCKNNTPRWHWKESSYSCPQETLQTQRIVSEIKYDVGDDPSTPTSHQSIVEIYTIHRAGRDGYKGNGGTAPPLADAAD